MAVFMDKNTKHTLAQLDLLEIKLRACEKQLQKIGRSQVPVYFGVPTLAREGFTNVYQALAQMRFWLTGQGFPPEG